jgi:hypothetical protein
MLFEGNSIIIVIEIGWVGFWPVIVLIVSHISEVKTGLIVKEN